MPDRCAPMRGPGRGYPPIPERPVDQSAGLARGLRRLLDSPGVSLDAHLADVAFARNLAVLYRPDLERLLARADDAEDTGHVRPTIEPTGDRGLAERVEALERAVFAGQDAHPELEARIRGIVDVADHQPVTAPEVALILRRALEAATS